MRPRRRSPRSTPESRSDSGVSDRKSVLLVLPRPAMGAQCTPPRRNAQRTRPFQETRMTPFTVHAADSAPADSRPLLDGIRRGFGFVPNLFAVIAESPAALRGALSIHEAFAGGSLTPEEQQLVMLA